MHADTDFALALACSSFTGSQLAWFSGEGQDVKQLNPQARVDVEEALKLAPDLTASQLTLGYTEYWGRQDYGAALKLSLWRRSSSQTIPMRSRPKAMPSGHGSLYHVERV